MSEDGESEQITAWMQVVFGVSLGSRKCLANVRIVLGDQNNGTSCPVPSSNEVCWFRKKSVMILDLHLVLSSVGLSAQRPPTHTTRCPSSGTVLVSSHPFLKQVWLHTLQSNQPGKPLRLAVLGKGIGRVLMLASGMASRAPAPTAVSAQQQKQTVGRNPSPAPIPPPPWWDR